MAWLSVFATLRSYSATVITAADDAPEAFARALASLRAVQVRPDLRLGEVPGPVRAAPYAVALSGSLLRSGTAASGTATGDSDDELADGRFIVLHDPAGQEEWRGTFRVVTLVRGEVDAEMGSDPMLNEVAWTWTTDALSDQVGDVDALSGTVTRVVSQAFGAMAAREDHVEIEIRASWTPRTTDLGAHLLAWEQLLTAVAGTPHLPDGVTPLHPLR